METGKNYTIIVEEGSLAGFEFARVKVDWIAPKVSNHDNRREKMHENYRNSPQNDSSKDRRVQIRDILKKIELRNVLESAFIG